MAGFRPPGKHNSKLTFVDVCTASSSAGVSHARFNNSGGISALQTPWIPASHNVSASACATIAIEPAGLLDHG